MLGPTGGRPAVGQVGAEGWVAQGAPGETTVADGALRQHGPTGTWGLEQGKESPRGRKAGELFQHPGQHVSGAPQVLLTRAH